MYKLQIAIGTLLAILPSVGSATTLVGIWTAKQITIAADSKQTLMNGVVIMGSQDACKIYKTGNLVFAFAGLAKSEQIDVVEAVINAHELTEQGTGKKLPVDSLEVASVAALVKVLKARGSLSDASVSVGLIIAGKIDGKLQMIRMEIWGMTIAGDFAVSQMSRHIAYPESRGHDGTNPNRRIEIIGFNNAIKRLQASSSDWNKGNDLVVARRLVEFETDDPEDSRFVGAPISEIVINKHGIKWIGKGKCQCSSHGAGGPGPTISK
jgi:ATP-dependent protease HslVU (ClpYQ) peptidase subunit